VVIRRRVLIPATFRFGNGKDQERKPEEDGDVGKVERREVPENKQVGRAAEEQTFAEVCDSSTDKQRHRKHRVFAGRQHRVLDEEEKQRKNNDARDDGEPEGPEAKGTAVIFKDTEDNAVSKLNTFGAQGDSRQDFCEQINNNDTPGQECEGRNHEL